MDDGRYEVFLPDPQLKQRWQCSAMKLWRLRKQGILKSIKVGGVGVNLTPLSHVIELEKSRDDEAA
jgi:hypothetical protein